MNISQKLHVTYLNEAFSTPITLKIAVYIYSKNIKKKRKNSAGIESLLNMAY